MAADLSFRLQAIRARMAQACVRAGRAPDAVTLIGVTKGVPAPVIQAAIDLGLTDMGENRVQEALAKRAALTRPPQRRHFIGHLQRNKAALAAAGFEVIHSVDSLGLLEALERAVASRQQPLSILLQVNVAGEATKFGCLPQALPNLARAALQRPHLQWVGLMTIPPWSAQPEDARVHFRALRAWRDRLQQELQLAPGALRLSMGMSADFEVAIEEGADWIRVGTAIFGTRATKVSGTGSA
jgi:pyridoxal phosphate enzyme (YggS family)